MPKPVPLWEIFVFSTEMAGVHLRGGTVARGMAGLGEGPRCKTPQKRHKRASPGTPRKRKCPRVQWLGTAGGSVSGETGIRTPDTGLTPYNGLANRRLQPLGHLSRRFER